MTDQESLDHWLSLWWPETTVPLPTANAVITDIQEPEEFQGSFDCYGVLDMDQIRKEDPSLARGIDAHLKETIANIQEDVQAMTVADLKEYLENVPDSLGVIIEAWDEQGTFETSATSVRISSGRDTCQKTPCGGPERHYHYKPRVVIE